MTFKVTPGHGTPELYLGMTRDEVVATIGSPDITRDDAGSERMSYPDLYVTVVVGPDGQVSRLWFGEGSGASCGPLKLLQPREELSDKFTRVAEVRETMQYVALDVAGLTAFLMTDGDTGPGEMLLRGFLVIPRDADAEQPRPDPELPDREGSGTTPTVPTSSTAASASVSSEPSIAAMASAEAQAEAAASASHASGDVFGTDPVAGGGSDHDPMADSFGGDAGFGENDAFAGAFDDGAALADGDGFGSSDGFGSGEFGSGEFGSGDAFGADANNFDAQGSDSGFGSGSGSQASASAPPANDPFGGHSDFGVGGDAPADASSSGSGTHNVAGPPVGGATDAFEEIEALAAAGSIAEAMAAYGEDVEDESIAASADAPVEAAVPVAPPDPPPSTPAPPPPPATATPLAPAPQAEEQWPETNAAAPRANGHGDSGAHGAPPPPAEPPSAAEAAAAAGGTNSDPSGPLRTVDAPDTPDDADRRPMPRGGSLPINYLFVAEPGKGDDHAQLGQSIDELEETLGEPLGKRNRVLRYPGRGMEVRLDDAGTARAITWCNEKSPLFLGPVRPAYIEIAGLRLGDPSSRIRECIPEAERQDDDLDAVTNVYVVPGAEVHHIRGEIVQITIYPESGRPHVLDD